MLLERDGLLEALESALAQAAKRSGRLVLVAGEAGAGKTSMIQAFTSTLGRETLVIQGACDPLTTPRPLSPLHDFAADPESGIRAISGRERNDVFDEVLERLAATARPIVMLVEDIHWADEGTLDFLRFVGRRVAGTRSIVVATYRDDEVGPDHPLRPVLGQLIPLESTTRLMVPPLSERAVTELVRESSIDPHELHRLSGGNAFFVTEVIASGDALPNTVQEAVMARVGRLDTRTRRVVEGVAIAPRSLEVEKVASLVGAPAESIDQAVGSGVLVGEGMTLRFRHDLARAAVEESIPPGRRLAMHQRMIALLEEDEQRDPARLAHHAIRAEVPELIVEYAPEAARDAAARGSRREAVAFYQAALLYPKELGDDRTAANRVALSIELRTLDDPAGAEREVRLALQYLRSADDISLLSEALGSLQGALSSQRKREEMWKTVDEALELLRPFPQSPELAMALYRAAHYQMLARRRDEARKSVDEALEVSRRTGEFEPRWLAEMMSGCVEVVMGDALAGVRALEQSLDEARARENPRFVAIALSMLGSGSGEARLYEAASRYLEEGVEQGLATDEDYTVSYDRAWQARIAFEQGRWDEAVDSARLVEKTTDQTRGIAYVTAMTALGRTRIRRGDPGGLELIDEMVEIGHEHELQHAWNAICGRAEHYWLRGRPHEPGGVLESAYQRALETDSAWAHGEIGFWMWRLGAIESPSPTAAEPFALQMNGDWREAADAWREIGCPYEVGLALLDGDQAAVVEAISIFDTLGARPAADMARHRLREQGAASIPRGPSAETRQNPHGLTPRQYEVLQLMARGLTNPEIAAELYISKKTVEHHVSAVFTKLGVSDRTEAIAGAREVL